MEQERFVRAEIDGVLILYSRIKVDDIIRRFYPSETESVFYEEIDIITRLGAFETVGNENRL